MLNWLAPSGFWLLSALIPVIIFYFLRIRFRKQTVSSNYIWSRLQKENTSNTRIRFRSLLLLILQIIIVLMLAFSASQPACSRYDSEKPGIIYLLDNSSSMSAIDVADNNRIISRWEKAADILKDELSGLQHGTDVAVFTCSSETKIIGTGKSGNSGIIDKLKNEKPEGTSFNEEIVFNELSAWLKRENRPWKACLITDGGLDLHGQKIYSLFNNNLKIILTGSGSENIGITALRFQSGNKASFSVMNGYETNKNAYIFLERNNKKISEITIDVKPGWSQHSVILNDNIQPGVYKLQLNTNDRYNADNAFYYIMPEPLKIRVLFAGRENVFLNAALKQPDLLVSYTANLENAEIKPDNYDIIIANDISIPGGVKGNLLCFNTGPESQVSFGSSLNGYIELNNDHPLVRFTNVSEWFVANGRSLDVNTKAAVILKIKNEPAMCVWEDEGNHYAVFGVDLASANIGVSAAFPVFIQNFIRWCVPQRGNDLAYTLTAGMRTNLRAGRGWKLNHSDDAYGGMFAWSGRISSNGKMLSLEAKSPGIFRWKDDQRNGYLAVNIPAGELDIVPQMLRALPFTDTGGIYKSTRQKDITLLPLLILLLFFAAEWFFWRGKSIQNIFSDIKGKKNVV